MYSDSPIRVIDVIRDGVIEMTNATPVTKLNQEPSSQKTTKPIKPKKQFGILAMSFVAGFASLFVNNLEFQFAAPFKSFTPR
jgi:hypothetical protein